MIIIEGNIVNYNKKKFLGQIVINEKTGLIENVLENRIFKQARTFGKDCLIFPGFGDLHVHAREDRTKQHNYKEDYITCGDAALQGGVTHISVMPNTPKPLTTKKEFLWHRNKIAKNNHPVEIFNYIGINKNTRPIGKVGEHFYKLYFGKSFGNLSIYSEIELEKVLRKYKSHHISFHVEYEPIIECSTLGRHHTERRPRVSVLYGLKLLLPLIKKYNIKAKLCHWNIGIESFELIKKYKALACDITLEVSPLHLLFDIEMAEKDPSLWTKIQGNPAIQLKRDRIDLIQGIKDGFIDYIATDHAPHTKEEKFIAFNILKEQYPQKTNLAISSIIKNKDKNMYDKFLLCEWNKRNAMARCL